jgi:hypothetical protein
LNYRNYRVLHTQNGRMTWSLLRKNERAHAVQNYLTQSLHYEKRWRTWIIAARETQCLQDGLARETMENVAARQGQFPPGSIALIEMDKSPFIEEK